MTWSSYTSTLGRWPNSRVSSTATGCRPSSSPRRLTSSSGGPTRSSQNSWPAGRRAVRAADRRVAAVVQRVVGEVVVDDVAPDVGLGPVGERVGLPTLVLG